MRDEAVTAIAALSASDRTVAVGESLTGGLVCASLTDVSGASAVFVGGVVSYTVPVKQRLLNVDARLLADVGPVHPAVAREMALGAAAVCGADIGVATTGVAGPTGHGGSPPGLAFIGWSAGGTKGVIEVHAEGDRASVRETVTRLTLQVITQCAERGAARSDLLSGEVNCSDRE